MNKITGQKPSYITKDYSELGLLGVGSIIGFSNKNTVVWGSGAMHQKNIPNPNADYRAVRGPLTRDLVLRYGGDCPEVYGDPGLLLPHFYTPTAPKKYRIGIIPPYVDYVLIKGWYKDNPDVKIINLVNSNIEQVINDIAECENIISSSLHGIIAAQVYGVNAHWVSFSSKVLGDGTKFKDYFASVEIEMDCIKMDRAYSTHELTQIDYIGNIQFDPTQLLNAFPHDLLQ